MIYQNVNKNLRFIPMTFASDSSEMMKFRKIDNVVMICYIYTRGVQPAARNLKFSRPRKFLWQKVDVKTIDSIFKYRSQNRF